MKYVYGLWHSPLANARFGAIALAQQAGIWLRYAPPKSSPIGRTSDTRWTLGDIL